VTPGHSSSVGVFSTRKILQERNGYFSLKDCEITVIQILYVLRTRKVVKNFCRSDVKGKNVLTSVEIRVSDPH
jgi:hypothetical protein